MLNDDPRMSVDVTEIDGGVRVAIAGEIDVENAHQLRPTLSEATARGDLLQLDLSKVEFIDSSGLRVLVEAWAAIREGASFSIAAASENAHRVFRETGLDATFGLSA